MSIPELSRNPMFFDIFRDAYTIIFGKPNFDYLNPSFILSDDELSKINELVKSSFTILDTLGYDLDYSSEYELRVLLPLAVDKFYKTLMTPTIQKVKKRGRAKQTNPTTAYRRKFKSVVGSSPEQLHAACIFYLLEPLKQSIDDKNLCDFAGLIFTMTKLSFFTSINRCQVIKGNMSPKLKKEKQIKDAYRRLLKDYRNGEFKIKSEEGAICKIQEHYLKSSNNDLAKEFLSRLKSES